MELTFEISGCFEKREEILWYMVTQSAAIALESLGLCILQWWKIAWLQRIIYKLLETYSHSQAPLWTKCNQRYRECRRFVSYLHFLQHPAHPDPNEIICQLRQSHWLHGATGIGSKCPCRSAILPWPGASSAASPKKMAKWIKRWKGMDRQWTGRFLEGISAVPSWDGISTRVCGWWL